MSEFTIDEVLGSESFTTDNGQFTAYRVRFHGAQGRGEAEHRRRASSPAPIVGEAFEGEIVHQGDKVLLKRVYRPQSAPSGAKNSSSTWKPEDPKRAAEIRQMAAHKPAATLLLAEVLLAIAQGKAGAFEGKKMSDLLGPRVEWFVQNTIDAGLRAELPNG